MSAEDTLCLQPHSTNMHNSTKYGTRTKIYKVLQQRLVVNKELLIWKQNIVDKSFKLRVRLIEPPIN